MDKCDLYLHYHENDLSKCEHGRIYDMAVGEVFNKANVKIGDQTFDRAYAYIYGDTATAAASDGRVLARMSGTIEVTNASSEGAEWSNGTETWHIDKVGCGCGSS